MTFNAAFFVIIWLACLAVPAPAAELPDIIQRRLIDTQKICTEHGGKVGPTTDVAAMADVDGNGQKDFVLDYRKLSCEGIPNVYCAAGFCTIDVYTWRAEGLWKLLLVASVANWKTSRVGKRPAFILT